MIFPTTKHSIKVGQKYMSYLSYKSIFKKDSDIVEITEVWTGLIKYKNIYGSILMSTPKEFINSYVLVNDVDTY